MKPQRKIGETRYAMVLTSRIPAHRNGLRTFLRSGAHCLCETDYGGRRMVNLDEVESEIRRRFSAVAAGPVDYREDPTIGVDRDMISFLLEWLGPSGEFGSVAV